MSLSDDTDREFENMRNRMRRWLEQTSQHRVSSCPLGKVCWIPSADIHETEKAYHLFVDLAGVDPATIEVVVEGNVLRLSGERQRLQVESCTRVHQLEIDFGPFRRILRFPASLDPEGARSSYRHGILEIILPKLHKVSLVQVPLKEE